MKQKKLILTKKTIVNLAPVELDSVRGGNVNTAQSWCQTWDDFGCNTHGWCTIPK